MHICFSECSENRKLLSFQFFQVPTNQILPLLLTVDTLFLREKGELWGERMVSLSVSWITFPDTRQTERKKETRHHCELLPPFRKRQDLEILVCSAVCLFCQTLSCWIVDTHLHHSLPISILFQSSTRESELSTIWINYNNQPKTACTCLNRLNSVNFFSYTFVVVSSLFNFHQIAITNTLTTNITPYISTGVDAIIITYFTIIT